jgi:hypothetical protein
MARGAKLAKARDERQVPEMSERWVDDYHFN